MRSAHIPFHPKQNSDGSWSGKDGAGASNPDDGGAGAAKPFLGDPPKDGDGEGEGNGEGQGGGAGDPPKPIEESEYLSALVKDEALLGDDKSITLDGELFKSVVPILQKHGIAPAAANEMANALAKAQIEQAKERVAGIEEELATKKATIDGLQQQLAVMTSNASAYIPL